MGGNLFKGKTKRVSKSEYNQYVGEISNILIENKINNFKSTLSIEEKQDFGDIDILIDDTYDLTKDRIKQLFGAEYVDFLSEGISFVYKETQVDFIKIDWFNKEIESLFYDWNDLGNMFGRLSKHFRCKLRPYGLYFILFDSEDKSKKVGEYFLTKSVEKIFKLLKLDFIKYKQGFKTFKEAFDFIINCPYFNKKFFVDREFNNGTALKRDNKRKVYTEFVSYVTSTPDKEVVRLSLEENIKYLSEFFPEVNLLNKIKTDIEKLEKYKLYSSKWNGNIFKEITGLEGKQLGDFIKWINSKYPDKDYIIELTQSQIQELVFKSWNEFKFLGSNLK